MTRFEKFWSTSTFSYPAILHTYLPMKMEQTGCSETPAYKIHTPGNYPEESIQDKIVLCTFQQIVKIMPSVFN